MLPLQYLLLTALKRDTLLISPQVSRVQYIEYCFKEDFKHWKVAFDIQTMIIYQTD